MSGIFDSLNYDVAFQVLDAQHYGLPQMRKRIFAVGIRRDIDHKQFAFPEKVALTKIVPDYLDAEVDDIYYLPEKGFKWVTDWERNQGKARVNRDVMGCQTAVQQINWSGDFRLETPKPHHYNHPDIYVGKYNGEDKMARLRKLDASVTKTAQVVALVFGIIGALILGFGMSLCMTDLGEILGSYKDMAMVIGIIVGVVGGILASLAYPIYNAIVKAKRKKLAPEIIRLTDELMK
jgi:hypothetical protein